MKTLSDFVNYSQKNQHRLLRVEGAVCLFFIGGVFFFNDRSLSPRDLCRTLNIKDHSDRLIGERNTMKGYSPTKLKLTAVGEVVRNQSAHAFLITLG